MITFSKEQLDAVEKAIVEVCNDRRAEYANDKQFAAVICARLSTTETAKRESEEA